MLVIDQSGHVRNEGGIMQEIIVLGEVPGTSITLSFETWAVLSIAILLSLLLVMSRKDISQYWHSRRADIRARKALRLLIQHQLL